MNVVSETKLKFIIDIAKKVNSLKVEIDDLDRRVLANPQEHASCEQKQMTLHRDVAHECDSVRGDVDNISRLIQEKEVELLSIPNREAKIVDLAYLMGEFGAQDDAFELKTAAADLRSEAPGVEVELANLKLLYGQLLRTAQRSSDRRRRSILTWELKDVWKVWREASRHWVVLPFERLTPNAIFEETRGFVFYGARNPSTYPWGNS